uniref:Uncharacterized protein n=1 Tax=Tetranychus urticae TaxID=32264 RepID=T1K6N9_TETUR
MPGMKKHKLKNERNVFTALCVHM